MDKQYLKEHNLTEAQKRFQSILEYVQTEGSHTLQEDDPQGPPQGPPQGGPGGPDPMGGGAPGGDPMGGGMPGGGPMGGDPMGGGAPGGDPNAGGAPGGDPNAAGGAPGGASGVEGFEPQVGDPNAMPPAPAPAEGGEDEEVIDVDELVDAQDDTKVKVAKLDGKIDALIKLIDKFESDIDQNNAHIDELKQEFEKRNPTQVEKMTLRAKRGYPFAQSPDEYWADKEQEGNYSPEDDNNGVGDERYQITKNDVDNITDWASIYKSIDDGSFHQDLKDILNF